MTMNDEPRRPQASRFASLILAHHESILEYWCSLLTLESDDPAAPFIRNQLDASLLALAKWFLDEDPASSTMTLQWAEIGATAELISGAVKSMSLLPHAVCSEIAREPDVDCDLLARKVAEFAANVTSHILRDGQEMPDEERWAQVASGIEHRYEDQRLQRIRRLSVLIEIAHAVSTSQDLDTLFEQVRNATSKLSGSDHTEISLLDQRSGKLRCHMLYAENERRPELEQTLIEQGLANEVLVTGTELVVSDYATACEARDIPRSTAIGDGPQRAWMGAPIRQGDQIIGVIAVSSPMTLFEQEDVELLAAIARQTAVALENRRLIEAEQRHVAQLSAVNRLAHDIAHLREPEELLATAVQLIHEQFNYGLVTIFLAQPDPDRLVMQARAPISVDLETEAHSILIAPGSVVGEVALTREPARHDDVHSSEGYLPTNSTASTRSEMAVPILFSGTLLGVLDVQSANIGEFDRHDVTTLQTIADQLAVDLENSRLFADEAQRTRELRLMLQTTRAASSSLQLDEVLEHLAEGIASAAGSNDCLIHLYDAEDKTFHPSVCVGHDPEAMPAQFQEWNRLVGIDECTDLQQLLTDPFPMMICPYPERAEVTHESTTTLLVPLRTRQQTLGMAVVDTRFEPGGRYPLNQLRLVQGVADSAALAVENARLYARAHGLAIAEERGRLAQEIHETLAQGLTAISLQLDLADSYLPHKPDQAASNVHRALELTRQNLDEARRSVLDLRAADVHEMSLPDAVSQLIRRLGEDSPIIFELSNEGLFSRLSARVEVGLYRILEEALENARQHSQASRVGVTLNAEGGTVSVLVEDDGQGFDPGCLAAQNGDNRGYGLMGIRERARLLGGSLTLSSNPGSGTSLRVVVPYEARLRSVRARVQPQGEQI